MLHINWKSAQEQAKYKDALEQHARRMKELFDAGKIVAAGPLVDEPYGVGVLEVASEDEARTLMEADPAVKAGAFRLELHTIRPALARKKN